MENHQDGGNQINLLSGIFPLSRQKAIIRGQIISLLIAGTGVFATLLSNSKPSSNFPSLMSLFNYVLLSTFLFRYRCQIFFQKDDNRNNSHYQNNMKILISSKYYTFYQYKYTWYFLAAVLDLEANFLVINAYNYTSVTSIMLLDCFTIPCVMILSFILLGYSYTRRHILGVIICTSGLGFIVLSDTIQYGQALSTSKNPVLGDFLCLSASMLYACSNVLQETLLKFNRRDVFLGYLGLFGSILAIIQCSFTDYPNIKNTHFTSYTWLCMMGFVLCLFFMYTNTSLFLQDNDSTLFNLSLLTSDVYAVIFSYFLYGRLVHWLYFLAFGIVVIGLSLYHTEILPTTTSTIPNFDETLKENLPMSVNNSDEYDNDNNEEEEKEDLENKHIAVDDGNLRRGRGNDNLINGNKYRSKNYKNDNNNHSYSNNSRSNNNNSISVVKSPLRTVSR